ncbi:MAG: FKBP-type peptidyl-prolyl cis-trans isomerase [Oligoflexia bacterium]|nr:FKBP-type peptidyl-prolyl cis-trans isomerase [Oligoflexia bacterium]
MFENKNFVRITSVVKGFVILLLVTSLASFLVSCQKKAEVKLKTEDDKVLYAMGVMFGGRMADIKLSEAELDILLKGFKDASMNKKSEVDMKDYQLKVRDFFMKRMQAGAEINKKVGLDYIDKFVKDEGAKKVTSGLAYKVLTEGTGKSPTANDTVEVHYKGTLIDGTVFDSSYERNQKVTFPLNRVIKGWTEGLQLVKEGGKIKLVIPPDLGYGDAGAPPKIPGGATLIFEIELFKIMSEQDKKNAAAAAPPAATEKTTKKKGK